MMGMRSCIKPCAAIPDDILIITYIIKISLLLKLDFGKYFLISWLKSTMKNITNTELKKSEITVICTVNHKASDITIQ